MTATSKIVDEIIDRFSKEIEKEKEISDEFRESLKRLLHGTSKVTGHKIERILYQGNNL